MVDLQTINRYFELLKYKRDQEAKRLAIPKISFNDAVKKGVSVSTQDIVDANVVLHHETVNPATLGLLFHCANNKAMIGMPDCNQRKINPRECAFNCSEIFTSISKERRTSTPTITSQEKEVIDMLNHNHNILEIIKSTHVMTEIHAVWYAIAPLQTAKAGVSQQDVREPVYSIMPDELVDGHRQTLGYCEKPTRENMIDLFNTVSINGVDDFDATFDTKSITAAKGANEEKFINSVACKALKKMSEMDPYDLYLILMHKAQQMNLLEDKQLSDIVLERSTNRSRLFTATRELLQCITPLRLGFIDGMHRIFYYCLLIANLLPSGDNAIEHIDIPQAMMKDGLAFIDCWKVSAASIYVYGGHVNTGVDVLFWSTHMCTWARRKSRIIQSSASKATVRTVNNVILSAMGECKKELMFSNSRVFSQKSSRENFLKTLASSRQLVLDALVRPDNAPFSRIILSDTGKNLVTSPKSQHTIQLSVSVSNLGTRWYGVHAVLVSIIRFLVQFVFDQESYILAEEVVGSQGMPCMRTLKFTVDSTSYVKEWLLFREGEEDVTARKFKRSALQIVLLFLQPQQILAQQISEKLHVGKDGDIHKCFIRYYCIAACIGKEMLRMVHTLGCRLPASRITRLIGTANITEWMSNQKYKNYTAEDNNEVPMGDTVSTRILFYIIQALIKKGGIVLHEPDIIRMTPILCISDFGWVYDQCTTIYDFHVKFIFHHKIQLTAKEANYTLYDVGKLLLQEEVDEQFLNSICGFLKVKPKDPPNVAVPQDLQQQPSLDREIAAKESDQGIPPSQVDKERESHSTQNSLYCPPLGTEHDRESASSYSRTIGTSEGELNLPCNSDDDKFMPHAERLSRHQSIQFSVSGQDRPRERCISGQACMFPNLEINSAHQCVKCRGYLHVFCVAMPDKDDPDKGFCAFCAVGGDDGNSNKPVTIATQQETALVTATTKGTTTPLVPQIPTNVTDQIVHPSITDAGVSETRTKQCNPSDTDGGISIRQQATHRSNRLALMNPINPHHRNDLTSSPDLESANFEPGSSGKPGDDAAFQTSVTATAKERSASEESAGITAPTEPIKSPMQKTAEDATIDFADTQSKHGSGILTQDNLGIPTTQNESLSAGSRIAAGIRTEVLELETLAIQTAAAAIPAQQTEVANADPRTEPILAVRPPMVNPADSDSGDQSKSSEGNKSPTTNRDNNETSSSPLVAEPINKSRDARKRSVNALAASAAISPKTKGKKARMSATSPHAVKSKLSRALPKTALSGSRRSTRNTASAATSPVAKTRESQVAASIRATIVSESTRQLRDVAVVLAAEPR